jgi:WXG100 family type VII secretion target
MAVEGISIALNEVSATASSIRTLNTTLETDLENIKTEIANLESTWQSDAGETIRSKINAMETQFQEYKKIIEAYAKFLDDTVTSYQQTESAINTNASAFQ